MRTGGTAVPRLVPAAVLVVISACGGDPAAPSSAFSGSYHASKPAYEASVLTVTDTGGSTDLLANGTVLDITLTDDGLTTGRLFAPGANEGGGDLDVSLDGSWTATNGVVRFNQDADTFMRDIPFTLSGNLLSGTFTSPDAEVKAVLVRD